MDSSDSDRIRYAQIAAAVARYVQDWRFTAGEEAAAVAELAQAAAGRADLLAERAGTALGFSQGGLEPARNRQIAALCIAAGADQALMGRWVAVGRALAARAAAMPSCRPAGDCASSVLRGGRYAAQRDPRAAPGRLQSRTERQQSLKGLPGYGFRS